MEAWTLDQGVRGGGWCMRLAARRAGCRTDSLVGGREPSRTRPRAQGWSLEQDMDKEHLGGADADVGLDKSRVL